MYKGVCVTADTTGGAAPGYARMAATGADRTFVGISLANRTGGAANGDVKVPVQPLQAIGYIELDAVSPTDAWIGDLAYFDDDHTATLTSTTRTLIGRVVSVTTTGTAGRVVIDVLVREQG